MLSLYFNQYPYLYNLLSFNEVSGLLDSENENAKVMDNITKLGPETIFILFEEKFEKFSKKIKNNKSILDDKKELKYIQTFLLFI